MKLPTKRLKVYPNPWGISPRAVGNPSPCDVTIDDEGRPRGIVHVDRNEGGPGRLLGAELCPIKTVFREAGTGLPAVRSVAIDVGFRFPRQVSVYNFLGISAEDPLLADKLAACEPEEIPNTPYYREQLQDGALIAANEATHLAAGIVGKFIDPKEAIRTVEAAAITAFNSSFEGADAFRYFQAERAGGTLPTEKQDSAGAVVQLKKKVN